MDYKIVRACRICNSTNLRMYLDLDSVPLANSLKNSKESDENIYPIQVLFCEDCSLSQLSIVVNPELMFSEYLYHSSISSTFKRHCKEMAKTLKPLASKNDPPSLIDIAANDGCLMEQFRDSGYVVRGFDPCKEMCESAWKDKRLLILPHFFNKDTAKIGRSWGGEDFITATNVFAHVDDLHGFLEGVKYHFESNPKGIFVAEFPYFKNLLHNNQFDTIYHEHLSYFLLKPLVRLFNDCGMPIFKVEEHDIHGGSLRIYASMYRYPKDFSVDYMIKFEEALGLHTFKAYENFSKRVDLIREQLYSTLEYLHKNSLKVMGYGASAKGISLLNYCNIPPEWIEAIVDETPQKQDKFTPGTTIPIVDFNSFEDVKPDYILLLAWNFEQELRTKTCHLGAKYIIPIPEVRVI